MACRIILSAPVPVPFLWTLDFGLGFGTWILDLDFGLDLGLTIMKERNSLKTYIIKEKNYLSSSRSKDSRLWSWMGVSVLISVK